MRPLTANLKLLYQSRFLWLFHLCMLPQLFPLFEKVITGHSSRAMTIGLPLLMFSLYGFMVGGVIVGSSAKPFAFCLPDHARELKKMLLIFWLLITTGCLLILAILYLFGIHIDPALFIAYIGLLSLSFWLGISHASIKYLQFSLIPIIILVPLCMFFKDTGMIIVGAIDNHPLRIGLACGILSYLICHATGSRNNHRRICESPWIVLGTTRKSRQRLVKQRWIRASTKNPVAKPVEWFAIYFTKRIRSKHHSGLIPHLWGQVYLIIAPILNHWKMIWVPFLGAYIMLILIPCVIVHLTKPGFFYFFNGIILILSSLGFSTFCINQRFKNFLFPGRRVYFTRGIVVLLTTMLLSLGFFSVSFLSFNFLSTLFPRVILLGNPIMILQIPLVMLIIPFITVPLFGGLFVLLREIELKMALYITAVIATIVSISAMPSMETAPFFSNLLAVIIIAAITWGFHFAALYHTSMKRSLY